MKLFVKMLIFIVLAALVAPLFIKGPDGKPLMSLSDWLPDKDQVIGMARQAGTVVGDLAGSSKQAVATLKNGQDDAEQPVHAEEATHGTVAASGKMYKWQDAEGHWHFSNQKPRGTEKVSLEDLPEVENVMDAPVAEENNASMTGLPDLRGLGDMLEKAQRASADRPQ